jgi:hypothetical protein
MVDMAPRRRKDILLNLHTTNIPLHSKVTVLLLSNLHTASLLHKVINSLVVTDNHPQTNMGNLPMVHHLSRHMGNLLPLSNTLNKANTRLRANMEPLLPSSTAVLPLL